MKKLIIICSLSCFIIACKKEKGKNILSPEKTIEINNYLEKESQNTLGLAVAFIIEGHLIYENI